ncbi:MAG: Na+/H+ antiporter subunit E [bacterium]
MKLIKLGEVNKIFITFLFMIAVWLLFTFSLDPFSLLLGVIFSFSIAIFTYDLFIDKQEKIQQGKFPRFHFFFTYIFVLLYEIYLGSFLVVYAVITNKIEPGLINIKTNLKSKFARAMLANSITLTPGTVTVDLHDDNLLVHWLNAETTNSQLAANRIKGRFETQLKRIFY